MIDTIQVIGWILIHQERENAFPGWPDDQIARTVLEHFRDDEAITIIDDTVDQIIGILLYSVNDKERVIRIEHIITDAPVAIKGMLAVWYIRYPEYDLIGQRGGQERRYKIRNFQRLLRKNDTPYHVTEVDTAELLQYTNN